MDRMKFESLLMDKCNSGATGRGQTRFSQAGGRGTPLRGHEEYAACLRSRLPNLGCGAVAERLREWPIDYAHAQIVLSNELGGCGVLCNFERERANAAGSLEQGPAKQHRLALRKAHTDAVGKTLPAHLIGVEESTFELGPDVGRRATDRGR